MFNMTTETAYINDRCWYVLDCFGNTDVMFVEGIPQVVFPSIVLSKLDYRYVIMNVIYMNVLLCM